MTRQQVTYDDLAFVATVNMLAGGVAAISGSEVALWMALMNFTISGATWILALRRLS
jgi:hypothetical protein